MTAALYVHAVLRIALCLLPQNHWREGDAPNKWNVLRNIPFALLGAMVCGLFFAYKGGQPFGLSWMWFFVLFARGALGILASLFGDAHAP